LQGSTTDYWIDEATLYIYQQTEQYTAQYHMDTTGTITSDTPNFTQDQTMTMMYSSFNVPVSIKAPANAQPLQNMTDLVS
jgi:peptidoglycan hydrolase-like protein with peptidoglycan-binding domain